MFGDEEQDRHDYPGDSGEPFEEVTEADLVGNGAAGSDKTDQITLDESFLAATQTVQLPTSPSASAMPADVMQSRTESLPSQVEDPTVIARQSVLPALSVAEEVATNGALPRRSGRPSESFDQLLTSDNVLLAEASVLPTLPSRAGARWLSGVVTTLLLPIVWYLLSDSAARLAFAVGNPWESGIINPAALIELGGGLLILVLVAVIAAQSSLGAIISGGLLILVGLPFLAVPAYTDQFISRFLEGFRESSAFGGNVVGCLELTGFTGVLVVAGTLLLGLGIALASVRKAGRREEATRAMVVEVNPEGVIPRWARKAGKDSA